MDAAITSRDDVRRVLIAGDTHGNTPWVERLITTAAEQGCPIVIQVGDFGYFPNQPDGPRFLTAVDAACASKGVELWFIDGNHDDHSALAEHRESDTPITLTEHVTYIPRGARVALGRLTFGFLGGAFSVDWRDRTHGVDWWPTERRTTPTSRASALTSSTSSSRMIHRPVSTWRRGGYLRRIRFALMRLVR